MNAKVTGCFISELRKEHSLTQKDLALEIHVTDKAISRWETGKGFPDIASLTALSKMFDVTINELLAGKRIEQAVPTESELIVSEIVKENTVVRKRNGWLSLSIVFLVLLILFCLYFDVPGWLSHRVQGGYTIVTVSSDVGIVDSYSVTMMHQGHTVDTVTNQDGLYYQSDYGDYQGTLTLFSDNPILDGMVIDFGFYNPNNWHKLHLNIHLYDNHGQITVKQTVACLTDNDAVLFGEKTDVYDNIDTSPNVYIGLL